MKFNSLIVNVLPLVIVWLILGIFNLFINIPGREEDFSGIDFLFLLFHLVWWISTFVGTLALTIIGCTIWDGHSEKIANWLNKKYKLGEYKDGL